MRIINTIASCRKGTVRSHSRDSMRKVISYGMNSSWRTHDKLFMLPRGGAPTRINLSSMWRLPSSSFVLMVCRVLVSANLLVGGVVAIGQEPSGLPDAPSASQTKSSPSSVTQSVPQHEPSKNHIFWIIPNYRSARTGRPASDPASDTADPWSQCCRGRRAILPARWRRTSARPGQTRCRVAQSRLMTLMATMSAGRTVSLPWGR